MRFLGFVFLLVLAVVGVGFYQGWFSVTTSHAGGKGGLQIGVDADKVAADAKAAADQLAKLSAQAAEKLRSLGKPTAGGATVLEAEVAAVDAVARTVTVVVGKDRTSMQVPATVPLTRAGAPVEFDQLQPGTRVKVTVQGQGDTAQLVRLELLP